jgi:hypothetical protein
MRRCAASMFASIALLAVVAPLPPAAADDVEAISVQANEVATKDYGPILGQDQVSVNVQDPDPMTCPLLPSCNLVPIDFVAPPGFSKLDTYLAQIDVIWTAAQVGDRNVGAATDDLDIYLYAKEWTETEPGQACATPDPAPADYEPPEYCTFPLAHSANNGAIIPETVRVDVQSHDHYLLAVNHASGVNQGYTVKVTSRYIAYGKPFESLETPFGTDSNGLVPPASAFTGSSGSGGTGADAFSPSASVPGASSLSPFGGIPGIDSDLTDLTGAGISGVVSGTGQIRRTNGPSAPPKPVSGSTVAFWLVLIPVVALGAGAVLFLRKRPAALRMRVPAPAR